MAGQDERNRPKQQQPGTKPPPAKPQAGKPAPALPPRRPPTQDSAFELTPVTGSIKPSAAELKRINTSSSTNLPKVAGSGFDAQPPRAPTLNELPRTTGKAPLSAKPTGSIPVQKPPPPVPTGPPPTTRPPVLQKQLHASAFDEDERTQIDAVLGKVARAEFDADEEEATGLTQIFDGVTPAREVTSTDTWKAVNAPVQSRPGRRTWKVYWNAIDQFAAGKNPRYNPDGPGKWRAHIFVGDVTRAMGCAVPRMIAGRELNLAQTVDWIRLEGVAQGWRKAHAADAAEAADRGEPVLALPRDPRMKLVAVVRPGGLDGNAYPRMAAAGPTRGSDLAATEALGTRAIEYFIHD